MNPFAAVNDGLIDITWVSDPAYQGTFGVTGIMSEAKAGQGVQAYKDHSKYMRGRKVRIDLPDAPTPEAPELELAPDNETPGEGETPAPKETPKQVIMIDGEPLTYEKTVIWECFPQNVEILIDDALFVSNKTFSRRLTPEVEQNRIYTEAVNKIWKEFD